MAVVLIGLASHRSDIGNNRQGVKYMCINSGVLICVCLVDYMLQLCITSVKEGRVVMSSSMPDV